MFFDLVSEATWASIWVHLGSILDAFLLLFWMPKRDRKKGVEIHRFFTKNGITVCAAAGRRTGGGWYSPPDAGAAVHGGSGRGDLRPGGGRFGHPATHGRLSTTVAEEPHLSRTVHVRVASCPVAAPNEVAQAVGQTIPKRLPNILRSILPFGRASQQFPGAS